MEDKWRVVIIMAHPKQKGLLPGYMDEIGDIPSKERYKEKLSYTGGEDPYELPRSSWIDDVDKWPNTTYMHVGLYLAFTPSPYTGEDLLNYKSLDCYQRFLAGWVREVLVAEPRDCADGNKILIAKVRTHWRLKFKYLRYHVLINCRSIILKS